MFKKLFDSLFGNKTIIDNNYNSSSISTLEDISNGMGEYASYSFREINDDIKRVKGQEMLDIITKIELNSSQLVDTKFYYTLAIAYRNYCAWFVRGVERKIYLEKTILCLKQSIDISKDNTVSKAELGRLLIEEKIVRNLSKGIEILENLKSINQIPDYLNSVLSKALRQNGQIEFTANYNLCSFEDPSPAVFREERKKFRVLIRECQKMNDEEKLKQVLNQYYNLAVLVTLCYKEHDCNSSVAGSDYEKAMIIVKKVCKKINYSFPNDGHIEDSSFISANDWKTFKKVFGDNTSNLNLNNMKIVE